MELKTNVSAEEGKQEIMISRTFDLPLELLFKAYTEPEFIEQWMHTKVIKFEFRKHGSYQFETTDHKGNLHGFNGVIHNFTVNQKIIRTFEMENSLLVSLEVYEFGNYREFKQLQQIIYQTVAQRDENLKLPFKQ